MDVDFRPQSATKCWRLQPARATVYAPIMEPFGFVPLESMACGTPVVGVCEGGVRETIRHEETGLLVDRDPEFLLRPSPACWQTQSVWPFLGTQGRDYVLGALGVGDGACAELEDICPSWHGHPMTSQVTILVLNWNNARDRGLPPQPGAARLPRLPNACGGQRLQRRLRAADPPASPRYWIWRREPT